MRLLWQGLLIFLAFLAGVGATVVWWPNNDQPVSKVEDGGHNTPEEVARETVEQKASGVFATKEQDQLADNGSMGEGLSLPLACEPNRDCFVQKYVDMAAGEDYRDFKCLKRTNDAHKGTDIRLLDMAQMEDGVAVLAAADGVVREARDHMPDVSSTLVTPDAVRARGYGNLVTLLHADGTVTAYAHLKRGSILVQPGDKVSRGQKLAAVGLSGMTEFPHLHFEVIRDGRRLDPFSGAGLEEGCPENIDPLWTDEVLGQLAYEPLRMVHMGFSDRPLNRDALEYGLAWEGTFPKKARNFILNVYLLGTQAGDRWEFRITRDGDKEPLVMKAGIYEKSRLFEFQYVGKAGKGQPWPSGRYVGEYRLLRAGAEGAEPVLLMEETREITVE